MGLTQDEAKAQGRDVAIGKALTTQNARTLIEGLGRGFMKLLFDRQTHGQSHLRLQAFLAAGLLAREGLKTGPDNRNAYAMACVGSVQVSV